MTSFRIVVILSFLGLILIALYYFFTRDSGLWTSLVATFFGLCASLLLVYQIVEKKIQEEQRARMKPVEQIVLNGVLAYSIAVVRRIGMLAGVGDLEPQLNESDLDLVKKAESFAKTAINEGLSLSHVHLQRQEVHDFLKETDDMLNSLFSLQRDYLFVFQEYPEIAKTLVDLRVACDSLKSAFYWWSQGSGTGSEQNQRLIEQRLTKFVETCDEVAESASRSLDRLRS